MTGQKLQAKLSKQKEQKTFKLEEQLKDEKVAGQKIQAGLIKLIWLKEQKLVKLLEQLEEEKMAKQKLQAKLIKLEEQKTVKLEVVKKQKLFK